jgi:twitching motility protein PilT
MLRPLGGEVLTPEDTATLARQIIPQTQSSTFKAQMNVDFSFGVTGLGRFRANVFLQRGSIALSIRRLPFDVPSFAELGLPSITAELANKKNGLIILTGPTGSGKSTTLASMIQYMNDRYRYHIITLEDPIEYTFHHNLSIVNQREVGNDVLSFAEGLRSALREDPDVVMLGEMRDLTSISAALTLAETGHLVLTTLHTKSAAETVDRIVDVFPYDQQQQVRSQFASVLEGIVSQRLLPRNGGGLVLAYEVLIATPAVRSLIREGKTHQIPSSIQTGASFGMITMENRLMELVKNGFVDVDEALEVANYPDVLKRLIDGQKFS